MKKTDRRLWLVWIAVVVGVLRQLAVANGTVEYSP